MLPKSYCMVTAKPEGRLLRKCTNPLAEAFEGEKAETLEELFQRHRKTFRNFLDEPLSNQARSGMTKPRANSFRTTIGCLLDLRSRAVTRAPRRPMAETPESRTGLSEIGLLFPVKPSY